MKMLDNFREEVKIYLAKSILKLENIILTDIQTKNILEKSKIDMDLDELNMTIIDNMIKTLDG